MSQVIEELIAPPVSFPLQNTNIICFAKDWTGDPTSVTHVMQKLAQYNRVLWLNSIATRAPNITSGNDLRKIFKKLASFVGGVKRVQENLWVYTPIVVPLPNSAIAVSLNRLILRSSLKWLRRKLGITRFQLWAWPPTAGEYVGSLGEELVVYYCTDNWSGFRQVDGGHMARLEDRLCAQADIVFATSRSLLEAKRGQNSETYLAPHGVDWDQFATALHQDLPTPVDLADCGGPVVGFYGLIENWMDQDLLVDMARRHPEWTVALVGSICVDVQKLSACSNIRLLGRKPHSELPAYCKRFSVGILPHLVNPLTLHMNPIKLREYMSAGLPVVSTALPEVEAYGEFCTVARDYDEFESALEHAIASDTPTERKRRSNAMRGETWEARVRDIGEHVAEAVRKKRADQPTGHAL